MTAARSNTPAAAPPPPSPAPPANDAPACAPANDDEARAARRELVRAFAALIVADLTRHPAP